MNRKFILFLLAIFFLNNPVVYSLAPEHQSELFSNVHKIFLGRDETVKIELGIEELFYVEKEDSLTPCSMRIMPGSEQGRVIIEVTSKSVMITPFATAYLGYNESTKNMLLEHCAAVLGAPEDLISGSNRLELAQKFFTEHQTSTVKRVIYNDQFKNLVSDYLAHGKEDSLPVTLLDMYLADYISSSPTASWQQMVHHYNLSLNKRKDIFINPNVSMILNSIADVANILIDTLGSGGSKNETDCFIRNLYSSFLEKIRKEESQDSPQESLRKYLEEKIDNIYRDDPVGKEKFMELVRLLYVSRHSNEGKHMLGVGLSRSLVDSSLFSSVPEGEVFLALTHTLRESEGAVFLGMLEEILRSNPFFKNINIKYHDPKDLKYFIAQKKYEEEQLIRENYKKIEEDFNRVKEEFERVKAERVRITEERDKLEEEKKQRQKQQREKYDQKKKELEESGRQKEEIEQLDKEYKDESKKMKEDYKQKIAECSIDKQQQEELNKRCEELKKKFLILDQQYKAAKAEYEKSIKTDDNFFRKIVYPYLLKKMVRYVFKPQIEINQTMINLWINRMPVWVTGPAWNILAMKRKFEAAQTNVCEVIYILNKLFFSIDIEDIKGDPIDILSDLWIKICDSKEFKENSFGDKIKKLSAREKSIILKLMGYKEFFVVNPEIRELWCKQMILKLRNYFTCNQPGKFTKYAIAFETEFYGEGDGSVAELMAEELLDKLNKGNFEAITEDEIAMMLFVFKDEPFACVEPVLVSHLNTPYVVSLNTQGNPEMEHLDDSGLMKGIICDGSNHPIFSAGTLRFPPKWFVEHPCPDHCQILSGLELLWSEIEASYSLEQLKEISQKAKADEITQHAA